jgi:hypothetical protein
MKMKAPVWLGLVCCSLIILLAWPFTRALPQTQDEQNPRPSAIGMAQYHAVQTGMSYEEVVKVLGRPGVEGARGATVVSYLWQNADGSIVAVVFTNGRVGSKTQGGLRE